MTGRNLVTDEEEMDGLLVENGVVQKVASSQQQQDNVTTSFRGEVVVHHHRRRMAVFMAVSLLGCALFGALTVNFYWTKVSSKRLHHQSFSPGTTQPIQELGWNRVLEHYRQRLVQVEQVMDDMDAQDDSGSPIKDISPLYEVIDEALNVVGIRGVYDGLFDNLVWYLKDDLKGCNGGLQCKPNGLWWFAHYVGAISAEKLLSEGFLLVDGVTGQRVYEAVEFVHVLLEIQTHPYTGHMSFHAEHAFIWHYVATTMPNLQEFPIELAQQMCGAYEKPRNEVRSHSGHKSLGVECYHAFGHAIYFVFLLRQEQSEGVNLLFHGGTSLSARKQVRPASGFVLSQDAMCEATELCYTAPKGHVKARERCRQGIGHSTVLFLSDDHDLWAREQECKDRMEKKQNNNNNNTSA